MIVASLIVLSLFVLEKQFATLPLLMCRKVSYIPEICEIIMWILEVCSEEVGESYNSDVCLKTYEKNTIRTLHTHL